jgi:hypothetical protein
VTSEEVRDLADRLSTFADWCYDREEDDDWYGLLMSKSVHLAHRLRTLASSLEEEELAR